MRKLLQTLLLGEAMLTTICPVYAETLTSIADAEQKAISQIDSTYGFSNCLINNMSSEHTTEYPNILSRCRSEWQVFNKQCLANGATQDDCWNKAKSSALDAEMRLRSAVENGDGHAPPNANGWDWLLPRLLKSTSDPVGIVEVLYTMTPEFQITDFATETPIFFSTKFISTWRSALKIKDCDLYDGDMLTGEAGGNRRLNSTTLTLQSGNHAEVTANVSPNIEYEGAKKVNIRFEFVKNTEHWRIDDVIIPSDVRTMPESITAYLNLMLKTNCRH